MTACNFQWICEWNTFILSPSSFITCDVIYSTDDGSESINARDTFMNESILNG